MSDVRHDHPVQPEAIEHDPIDGVDFFRRFSLPPLRRMSEQEEKLLINPLQVIQRLRALDLDEQDVFTPEQHWKVIYDDRRREQILAHPQGEAIRFEGTKVSELNWLLNESVAPIVQVIAPELFADETLRVPSRTTLIGNGTLLTARYPIESAIEVRDGTSVRIQDFEITGHYRVGIYVKNGSSITVEGNHIHDIDGRPVVVLGKVSGIDLVGNTIRSNGVGGMYLRGHIGPGLIQDNRIEDNRCTLNLAAGLVLTSRPVYDVNNPEGGEAPDGKFLRLQERLESPHDLVIRRNFLQRNASSGFYCCGAYQVFVIENHINDNDKEGMCADFGTIGSYIRGNRIAGNGGRRRQTDDDLRFDFVHHLGLMRDGSSVAKLPGLSIDNSAYNIIHENIVSGNFGGGIKTVRAGVRNLISHNLIIDNNRGQNSLFNFCGIEFGNARPDVIEATDLDFTPNHENIVFRNLIEGDYYVGIVLVEQCYCNDFFDNCIFGTTRYSIENLSILGNSSINNISNKPSWGIPLDANHLPEEERPQFEKVYHPYARKVVKVGRRVRSWYRSAKRSVTRAS